MLEQSRDIGLIAGDTIQRFGEHEIELAALGILQQGLDTRPQDDAGARYAGVLIGIVDRPPLPGRVLATDAELIFDRGRALIVVRVAGVKCHTGHRDPPLPSGSYPSHGARDVIHNHLGSLSPKYPSRCSIGMNIQIINLRHVDQRNIESVPLTEKVLYLGILTDKILVRAPIAAARQRNFGAGCCFDRNP